MNTIKIKLTKKQTESLKPLEREVEEANENDLPGAIIGQFYPTYGYFKCVFYTNAQMKKFHAVFDA